MKFYKDMTPEEKAAHDAARQEEAERYSREKRQKTAEFVEMDFSTRQERIDQMTTDEIGTLIGGATSWRARAMWKAIAAGGGSLEDACVSANHANAEARGERKVANSSHPEVSNATTDPVLELDRHYEAMHLFWLQAFVAFNCTALFKEPGARPQRDVVEAAEKIADLIARETDRNRDEILREMIQDKGNGVPVESAS